MKEIYSKIGRIVLIILLSFFIVMPLVSNADNESLSVVKFIKHDNSILIYINGMEKTNFNFSFSNDENATNLAYTTNLKDEEGNNLALMQGDFKYMFILKENQQTPQIVDIQNAQSITWQDVDQLNKITKNINVEVAADDAQVSNENGTKVTNSREKIVIKDNGNYQYQLLKVAGKNGNMASQDAVELYNQIHNVLPNATTMYDKLTSQIKIRDSYKKLLENSTWEDVKSNEIYEPSDAQDGDVFIALIKKSNNQDQQDTYDLQIMTCTREDAEGVNHTNQTVGKQVEKKTALPVTGENLALYIILAIVIIAIIVIAIRMKYVKGKNNEIK